MPKPIYDIRLHTLRNGLFIRETEFSQLGEEAKELLLSSSIRKTYRDREFIYLQDDKAEYFYFIASGHVRLSCLMEDGSAILYAILPPGDSFGELGAMEMSHYFDMATAVGTTIIRAVPAALFRIHSPLHAQLREALGIAVAKRYRLFVSLMKTLSLKTLPARLSQALLRVADSLDTKTQYGAMQVPLISSFVTQSDFGLMARGSRGNVNKLLKTWERAGLIVVQERNILILDRLKLEALAIEEGM